MANDSEATHFQSWIDRQSTTKNSLLPLTHITRGINARRIATEEKIEPRDCSVFQRPISYLFYGRPAYRVSGSSSVKQEVSCPFCFIFDGSLADRTQEIFAFDTGAFSNRLYAHVLDSDFVVEDFSLGTDVSRMNKLVEKVFGSALTYVQGDRSQIPNSNTLAEPHEFEARSYIDLIKSPGRNEPDDRICSIELMFGDPIPIFEKLIGVVVPHTMCSYQNEPPGDSWIESLAQKGIEILPYNFVPGRSPEFYHALLETAVINFYIQKSIL